MLQYDDKPRTNFYIFAKTEAEAIKFSKDLIKMLTGKYNNEIVYEIDFRGATVFENYVQQPIILWNNFTGKKLIRKTGGAWTVRQLLDPFPSSISVCVNAKKRSLGGIDPHNTIGIINGTQSFDEFFNEISEHDHASMRQIFRRIPFIVKLGSNYIDLLVNEGFSTNDDSKLDSYQFKRFYGNRDEQLEVICKKYHETYNNYIIDEVTARREMKKLEAKIDEYLKSHKLV